MLDKDKMDLEYFKYIIFNGLGNLEDTIDIEITNFNEFCKKYNSFKRKT